MTFLKPTLITGGILSAIFAFGVVQTATGSDNSNGYSKLGHQKELGYNNHSGSSNFKHPIYGYMFKHPVYGYIFKHPVQGYVPISATRKNHESFDHPVYGTVMEHPVYGYKFKHPKLGFIPMSTGGNGNDFQSHDEADRGEDG